LDKTVYLVPNYDSNTFDNTEMQKEVNPLRVGVNSVVIIAATIYDGLES
jgi:hypothetical protein